MAPLKQAPFTVGNVDRQPKAWRFQVCHYAAQVRDLQAKTEMLQKPVAGVMNIYRTERRSAPAAVSLEVLKLGK